MPQRRVGDDVILKHGPDGFDHASLLGAGTVYLKQHITAEIEVCRTQQRAIVRCVVEHCKAVVQSRHNALLSPQELETAVQLQ